ncbi:hypothetical protein [Phenylobacterium sp.]|uniref:hypothetical protein n=1 Tax=Phenylobacterium sp. TaxID=1871053 RepID=UPI00271B6328|nr:hypothetical protein [Phenylobacterium sp.]MDO8380071.1 hypothetical protein [Phenylobacterium sp.]
MNQHSLSEATTQIDQLDQRLLWTGAAANGALLLALIGFAGNSDDGAGALRDLTIPIALGVLGFLFGGTAISFGAVRLALRPLEALAQLRIDRANRNSEGFKDVLCAPSMDADVAQLVWGDQADDEVRKLLHGRLAAAKEAWEKSPGEFEEAMQSLTKHAHEGLSVLKTARRWLVASFIAAMLAVTALLALAWIRQPAPSETPPSSAAERLPPCSKGSATCVPWERKWKEAPPVGMVVPAPHDSPR